MMKACTEVTSTDVFIHLKDKHISMSLETHQNNSAHKPSTTACNRMRSEQRRENGEEKSVVLWNSTKKHMLICNDAFIHNMYHSGCERDAFAFFQLQTLLGLKSKIYKTRDFETFCRPAKKVALPALLDSPASKGIQLSMPRSPTVPMAGPVRPLPHQ